MTDEYRKLSYDLLAKMKRQAEITTQELGVSSQLKFEVLAEQHRSNVGPADVSLQDADPQKRLLRDLVAQFLDARNLDVVTFRQLWNTVVMHSLQALSSASVRSPQSFGALGFSRSSSELLPIISLTAWAILNPNASEQSLSGEARRRGLSLGTSQSLAAHLVQRLPRRDA